jgi:hypothetical protein
MCPETQDSTKMSKTIPCFTFQSPMADTLTRYPCKDMTKAESCGIITLKYGIDENPIIAAQKASESTFKNLKISDFFYELNTDLFIYRWRDSPEYSTHVSYMSFFSDDPDF